MKQARQTHPESPAASQTASKAVWVSNGTLTYIHTLTGACTSTEALRLKEELMAYRPGQHLLLDLSGVSQTDLITVNALVLAHRRHHLRVVLPTTESARRVFRQTKFDRVLSVVSHSQLVAVYG
jgi:anti-anti-sigma regulatory factor